MYNTESYKEPFWAENSGFMTGRDPLGIQNSSITTYGRLLPGMTNLTLRLRYYGFYMWVIREFYIKNEGRTDFTHREHYNFIRRGELILAYIMRKKAPGEKSIIGSNFSDDHKDDIQLNGYFNIHLGADKLKDTKKGSVYWDFRSGALGQYYVGSLAALKLISTEGQFFQIEPRGNKLADAFSDSIKIKEQKKFIDIIEDGRLHLNDIDELEDFRIDKIEPNTTEWDNYIDILLGNDGEGIQDTMGETTYLRKETISLLLNYFNQDIVDYNDRSFILHQFELNHNNYTKGASLGWYYYYLNEAFHIAIEAIFWSILVQLDGKPKGLESFLNDFNSTVTTFAKEELSIAQDDKLIDVVFSLNSKTISKQLKSLQALYKKQDNSVSVMSSALELIMLIYEGTHKNLENLQDFENRYKIHDQKGKLSENIKVYIEDSLSFNFEEFVKETIKKTMNDHVSTAYRKMGNGESNLLKFIIEDGIISHIQTMEPRHTSPRLKTITNFLTDLSLIDNENHLTSLGMEQLKNLSN